MKLLVTVIVNLVSWRVDYLIVLFLLWAFAFKFEVVMMSSLSRAIVSRKGWLFGLVWLACHSFSSSFGF